MAIYPTANATQMSDIATIFGFINQPLSGGLFFPIVMLGVWVIAFLGSISERREAYRSWIFANFVCSMLAIILGLLGFMSPVYIYFFIILLGFGVVWAMLARKRTF